MKDKVNLKDSIKILKLDQFRKDNYTPTDKKYIQIAKRIEKKILRYHSYNLIRFNHNEGEHDWAMASCYAIIGRLADIEYQKYTFSYEFFNEMY